MSCIQSVKKQTCALIIKIIFSLKMSILFQNGILKGFNSMKIIIENKLIKQFKTIWILTNFVSESKTNNTNNNILLIQKIIQ